MKFPRHRRHTALSVAIFLSIASGISQGATTTYTLRASFDSAAGVFGTVETEGYETYASDLAPGARTLSLDNFQVTYDLVGNISNFGIADVPNPLGGSGVSATSGTHYLFAAYPTVAVSDASVTFLFASPIYAFGTDIRDLENINLSYNTSTGESGTAANAAANGTIAFFGIVSDNPFTSITFTGPGLTTGDGVVFDQSSFVIPEPSSSVLLLAGSMVALLIRSRQHPLAIPESFSACQK